MLWLRSEKLHICPNIFQYAANERKRIAHKLAVHIIKLENGKPPMKYEWNIETSVLIFHMIMKFYGHSYSQWSMTAYFSHIIWFTAYKLALSALDALNDSVHVMFLGDLKPHKTFGLVNSNKRKCI